MGKKTISNEMIKEIYDAFENIGAKSDLLSIIGSYKDTMDDEFCLYSLKQYNKNKRDTKPKELCSLTDEELADKCIDWSFRLGSSIGKEWPNSSHVNLNNDPGLIMIELANRFKHRSL